MDSKRIVGGIVTFVALALAGEWIVRVSDVVIAAFYQDGVLDWSAVRAVVGMLALPVGLYFLFRPENAAKRQAGLDALSANMISLSHDIHNALEDGFRPTQRIFGEIASVYEGLTALGIATPDQNASKDLMQTYVQAGRYVDLIMPMIRDGHVDRARHHAPNIISKACGGKPSFPKRWWKIGRTKAG